MKMDDVQHGSCLCGQLSFTHAGMLPAPNACHCTQCRKQSGHYWASVDVQSTNVTIKGDVRWYQASDKVRRGFCENCGSFLFWDPLYNNTIALAMGAFNGPTKVHLAQHIFVADKGDYYDITDGLPRNQQ